MTTQTRLHVQGMKCAGCIANATKALEDLPGFENAEFDLQNGTAKIIGDIDPQAACQLLAQAGYPAAVNSEPA